jgi:hypothetical protein
MNTQLSKSNINKLSQDIINYILIIAGHYKYRNGKFIGQLDKREEIFERLLKIPLFKNQGVRFCVKTIQISTIKQPTFIDKIIDLYVTSYYENTNEDGEPEGNINWDRNYSSWCIKYNDEKVLKRWEVEDFGELNPCFT